MADSLEPLNWNSPIVNSDGTPSQYFMAWSNVIEAGATGPQGPQGDPGSTGSAGPVLTGFLTIPNWFVETYSDGTPISGAFTGATGVFRVFSDNNTEITGASVTYSSTASGVTGGINSVGTYNVSAMSGDIGTLTLLAEYNSLQVQLVFTVRKIDIGTEIVASLPVSNLYEGRVVFLTSDGKLYRYHSGAWTTAVPAVDVTGTLTNSQIADLDAAKLTGQITTTQISDDAITTPKILAGQVTTAKLAASAVTAEKISVGSPTANLVINPRGQDQDTGSHPAGWALVEGPTSGGYIHTSYVGWYNAGRWGMEILKSATTVGVGVGSRAFSVIPGKTYYVKMYYGGSASTANGLYIRVAYKDTLPASGYVDVGNRTGYTDLVADGPISNVGAAYEYTWTCPAGVFWVSFSVYNYANGPLSFYFSDVEFREQIGTVQIADGTITAAKIVADTITANEIASNAITTNELNAGAVTAAKIAANTITASQIAASTITATELASNSITAAKIQAGVIIASKFLTDQGVDILSIVPGTLGGRTDYGASYSLSATAGNTTNGSYLPILTTNISLYTFIRAKLTVNGRGTVAFDTMTMTDPAQIYVRLYVNVNGAGYVDTGLYASLNGSNTFFSSATTDNIDTELQSSWTGSAVFAIRVELEGQDNGCSSTLADIRLDLTTRK